MCGSAPLAAFQWSQKAMTSRFWVALDRSALAQEEVVGAAVLGEEGQHGAGALRAGGHVVLFQGRIRTPGHDAWKSRSKIASSWVASPPAIIAVFRAARNARWFSWLVR
jgi:hypothetical protein